MTTSFLPPRATSGSRVIVLFLVVSFVLHLLWENLQAPLYEGFTSFTQHFGICLKAALGDMVFMGIVYGTLALLHRDFLWIADQSAYARPSTWIVVVLTGLLLAVGFELWAVYVDHRWQYAEAMPLIPFVQVGLTPVLQMLLIPLTVLLLTSRSSHLV